MKGKPQIFFIHGGTTFETREGYLDYLKNKEIKIDKHLKWSRAYLDEKLGTTFDIIRPIMPLKEDAKYEDWKIFFERHFPFLNDNIILIGSSLGGIFLAKYLSENKFPKKILATYLVAPPFDNSIEGEDLVGGFELGDDLTGLKESSEKLKLLFAKEDPCVPVDHAEKYKEKLDEENIEIYDHIEGHFSVSEFPEIVEMINDDLRSRINNREYLPVSVDE